MKRTKTPCEICRQPLSPQGRPAHMRAKHPNIEETPHNKKEPKSVTDIAAYKQGVVDGVLEAVRRMA